MYCSDFALVQQHDFRTVVKPLYCKRWSCPICAPRRGARLMREAAEGNPNRFVTLTVRAGDAAGRARRARALRSAWHAFVIVYRRRHGRASLEYLVVIERTQRGEPHLHILCRSGYISQRWLSAFMGHRIGAPVVDVRAVGSARQAARYVGKYVAKGLAVFPGCKRYWRSLRYLQPSEYAPIMDAWGVPIGWRVVRERWQEYALKIAPAPWVILWARAEAVVHFPRPP